MTQKIHILTGSSGSYDDYSEWNIKAFFSAADAEAAKQAHEEKDVLFNEWLPRLQKAIWVLRAQPEMQVQTRIYPESPRASSSVRKQFTDDERRAYDRALQAWHDEVEKLQTADRIVLDKHLELLRAAFNALWIEMGVPQLIRDILKDQTPYHLSKLENSYDIESLDIV